MSAIRTKVRGLEKLRGLIALAQAPDTAIEAIAKVGQEQVLTLIGECFKSGTDPYGTPWDAPNNLQITGGIRSYARGKTDAGGFEVHATDEKAIWHHNPQPRANWGGKSLPQRLQVPTSERGLPPAWATRIIEVMEKSLELQLKRALDGAA